jgi:polyisoprenyl-teichoic acid--peptidoglycan teichoic acid transferase
MDNFRRRTRDNQRHAIDGILNAPVRSQDITRRPLGRRPEILGGLRSSNGRRVDDFKRAEGYHPAQSASSSAPLSPPHTPRANNSERPPSLLHMTLPSGGALGAGKKERKKAKDRSKHGRWHSIRKWTLRSALAVTVLVLLVGGVLVAKGALKIHKVFKGGGTAAALQADVKPELLKGEGDGRVNILLLGRGGGGHAGPDLTDTIIIASIDPVNKRVSLVSLPRDLWVTVPGAGSSKINAVLANAKYKALNKDPTGDKKKADEVGAKAIQDVVSSVLGIPIHYYGIVDFEAFRQAVDTVGGVDINVPAELAVSETLWDEGTGKNYSLNVKAGMQHFDGTRALFFTRSRHTSTRGDFDRAERQRLFIQSLGQKILSAGTYTNPVKISQLMNAFGDHVAMDLSLNNAVRLVQIGKGIDFSKMNSIGLADPPNNFVRTDNVNGASVVRPTAGFGDYSEIQNYIRNTLKDPYLAKENATIMVLNGTNTPGLATTKADQLKTYGYNVVTVDDAPTHDYPSTLFIDTTRGKKPFTKSYLEKRLDVKATTQLPDATIQTQGIDFVIILGQDG